MSHGSDHWKYLPPRLTREQAAVRHPEAGAAILASPTSAAGELYWAFFSKAVVEERTRIFAIEALAGPPAIIRQCVSDPDCTPAEAALRINEAQRGRRSAAAAALLGDEAALDPPRPTMPDFADSTSDEALARSIIATGQRVFGQPEPTPKSTPDRR